jgi:hypothetical protein
MEEEGSAESEASSIFRDIPLPELLQPLQNLGGMSPSIDTNQAVPEFGPLARAPQRTQNHGDCLILSWKLGGVEVSVDEQAERLANLPCSSWELGSDSSHLGTRRAPPAKLLCMHHEGRQNRDGSQI